MTALRMTGYSLLQTADRYPAEWWLVYRNTDRLTWWNRWLDPRFQHVEALKRDGRVWVAFRPHGEFVDVDVIRSDDNPWRLCQGAIIQRVVVLRKEGRLRSKFHVGPITCVDHMKALFGIRAWWLRTPHQLFNYCRRHYAFAKGTGTHARGDTAAHAADGRTRPARQRGEPPDQGAVARSSRIAKPARWPVGDDVA